MIVVSDTSPIINLAAIGQLDLLQRMYTTIIIPQMGFDEIVVAGAGQPGANEVPMLAWIEIRQVMDISLLTSLLYDLDPGEASAIELKADKVLLDEHRGRLVAEKHGLVVTGLLGILIRAKQHGCIPFVKPLRDDLIHQAGFWIADHLYQRIPQASGE